MSIFRCVFNRVVALVFFVVWSEWCDIDVSDSYQMDLAGIRGGSDLLGLVMRRIFHQKQLCSLGW